MKHYLSPLCRPIMLQTEQTAFTTGSHDRIPITDEEVIVESAGAYADVFPSNGWVEDNE